MKVGPEHRTPEMAERMGVDTDALAGAHKPTLLDRMCCRLRLHRWSFPGGRCIDCGAKDHLWQR